MGGIVKGIASGLTLAERKLAQLQDIERRRRWARRANQVDNVLDVVKRSHYRYRDQTWPWIIAAVLAVAYFLAAVSAKPSAVFALSLLGAGAVAFYLRDKLDRKVEWMRAGACLGGVVVGLTLVAIFGIHSRPLNIAWVLGFAVSAGYWWLHHEVRWTKRITSTFVKRWDDRIRDKKGPMAGAELDGPVTITTDRATTDSYVVRLVPGDQHIGLVWQNMPRISSGLQTPMEDLVMERHPDYPKDPTILRLNHVVKSPIDNTVYFDKPRFENGRVLLGPYADGLGDAFFRVYTDDSMWGGFVLGGIGAGKALDTDTPIPTPTGWTTMGALRPGDQVFDENGAVCTVVQAFSVQHDRPCYEVLFSDGERIVADADHLWWTEDLSARRARGRARASDANRIRRKIVSDDAAAGLRALVQAEPAVTIKQVADIIGISYTSSFVRATAATLKPVGRIREMGVMRYKDRLIPRPTSYAQLYPSREYVELLLTANDRCWNDQRFRRTPGKVRTTAEIRDSLYHGRMINHSIPVAKALELPDANLLIDPYVLGCWLGDGSAKSSEITSADAEIIDNINATGWRCVKRGRYRYSILPPVRDDPDRFVTRSCVGCGALFTSKYPHQIACSRRCRPARGSGSSSPPPCLSCGLPVPSGSGMRHRRCRSALSLMGQLKLVGVYRNKHIPSEYLRGGIAQRRALLAGLLDTDGTVSPQGGVNFDSTNERLAHDVHELALSLGYRATVTQKSVRLNGRVIGPGWRITFTTSDPVFRLSRKNEALVERGGARNPERTSHRYITDVRPVASRPVRCIAVDSPSRLFLAGRRMVPTHNSRLIEILAVTLRSIRDYYPTVVWYMDGQEGASSPMLFKHADWAVGTSGALTMLNALTRIGQFRNRQNRATGVHGFTPTAERPGIFVICDEFHALSVLNPDLFAKVAREFRKLGISILAADQDSNLAVFGNLDVLRASLLTGNGIAMRVASRIAGNLIPGLNMDPFDLPVLPGYGVLVAPPGSHAPTAGFRTRYSPSAKDVDRAEEQGVFLPVPPIEAWFETYEPLELDAGAAKAAGRDYTDRHEIAAQERAELQALVDQAELGNPLEALAELVANGVVDADPETTATLLEARRLENEATGKLADAILALPWDQHPEQMPVQMIDGLKLAGYEFNPSTLTKALKQLRDDGKLLQDEPRKPYRRA